MHFSALCVYIYLCIKANKKNKQINKKKGKTDLITSGERSPPVSVDLTMVESLIFTELRFLSYI